MVRARKLTKRYGERTILDRLDFEIERGERVALLGSNGAGKTTLFRCLLGLVGFEGRLTVDGLDAGPAGRELRSMVAYVPQVPPVFDLTLAGFVELFAGLRGVPVSAVGEHLDTLGMSLEETGARPLRALSGGMTQKAYLGLALAGGSRVLLLDEPTASLDPESRHDLLRHLSGVGRDTTMILASHRLEEIESLADRVMVLASGTIAFDGSLGAVWSTTGVGTGLWPEAPGDDGDVGRAFPVRDLRRLAPVLEHVMGSLVGNHRERPS
jgi:ABC-2 type transport system ATP-binding protein